MKKYSIPLLQTSSTSTKNILIFLALFIFIVGAQDIKSVSIERSRENIYLKLKNGQILVGNRKLVKNNGINGSILNTNIIYEFLGLPFAEPPIGQKRFRFPTKLNKTLTQDVYNATYFRSACMQPHQLALTVLGFYSEDCLYMNIWVPVTEKQDELLYLNQSNRFSNDLTRLNYIEDGFLFGQNKNDQKTSMFWIYGGSFNSGSGELYDGTVIASNEKVIVANTNYRLGVFGFLYLRNSHVPGNAGLADQVTAIEWYREQYLNYFGGSSTNLCLFGESAGAMSIQSLLLSKRNSLFNRVIMQSGAYSTTIQSQSISYRNGLSFANNFVGCPIRNSMIDDSTIRCLLSQNSSFLLLKQVESKFQYFPTVDFNGLIEENISDLKLIRKKKLNHDIFMGINQNEFSFFTLDIYKNIYFSPNEQQLLNSPFDNTIYDNRFVYDRVNETWAIIDDGKSQSFKNCFIDLYSKGNTVFANEFNNGTLDFNLNSPNNLKENSRSLAWKKYNKIAGDYLFNCPAVDFSEVFNAMNRRTYFYYFTMLSQYKNGVKFPDWVGCTHTDEIE